MEPAILQVPVSHGSTIFAYDFGGSGSPLMVSLLRSSFHIYGLDFRGHGRSPSSSDITLSLKLFADDVADALRTLRLDACYVFGHSLGGAVALACAANNPALFIGLFLFEPVVCAPSYSPTCAPKHLDSCILLTTNTTPSIELEAGTELLASIAQRRKGTFVSRAAAAANLRAKHPYAAFDPLSFDAFLIDGLRPAAGQTVQLACAPATEAAVFRFAAREAIENVFHRLGTVRAPAMVACGADTGAQFMWLPEGSKQVADALGNGKHTQLAALEHMGPMTHPALLAHHVKLCFAAIDGGHWNLLPQRMVIPPAAPRF